jgi:phytoene dehydrogenase-like protein
MESHYHGGAYFPKGGSTSIAKTMVASILRQGGLVYAKTPVKRILTKKDWKGRHVAIGVCVGECEVNVIARKGVISGAGFMKTFEVDVAHGHSPLVDDQRASASQLALVHNKDVQQPFKSSPAFCYLFVGLDGTDKELCLPGQNIWHVKNWEYDKSLEHLLGAKSIDEALKETPPLVFLSNESAKDPDFTKRHPGKATVTLIAWTNPEWFKKWDATQHGHRGVDYESMKKKVTETLLDILYLHFPLTKGRVKVAELGTPLTADKYLGRSNGEIYNLDHNVSRFETLGAQLALHPQTTLKNLYLAGQDVTAVSIEAATMSGFFAASRLSMYTMIFICIPLAFSCIPGVFWF